MTLSERLERARRERLLAAGVLHGEAALKPEAEVDVTDGSTDGYWTGDISIEARSAGLHSVDPADGQVQVADTRVLAADRHATCPNCRRPGRVDMVDLIGHVDHVSCPACGTLWRVPRPDH